MKKHPVLPDAGTSIDIVAEVRNTLGAFLGVAFTGSSPSDSKFGPVIAGMLAAGVYTLGAVLQMCLPHVLPQLLALSWWAVFYFGFVVALTRSTTLAVVEVCSMLIAPHLAEPCARLTIQGLRKHFGRRATCAKSLVAATIATAISLKLLWQFKSPQLGIVGAEYFMLYFTAAQATLTAQFYAQFARSLKVCGSALSVTDPGASPIISACSALAKRMISYWFRVFLLVMSLAIVPYAAPRFSNAWFACVNFRGIDAFVSAVIFVAGFFSFGFGSLIYLGFESDLRIAVDHVRLATLSTIQRRHAALAWPHTALSSDDRAERDWLEKTSTTLTAPDYYRSAIRVFGTTALTVLPPVLAMIGALLKP